MRTYPKHIQIFFEAGWVKRKENDYYLFIEKNGNLMKISLNTGKIIFREDEGKNLREIIEVVTKITGISEIDKSSSVVNLANQVKLSVSDFINAINDGLELKIANTSISKTIGDIILK